MEQRLLTLDFAFIPSGEHWLLISDHRWWNRNYVEIREWAEDSLSKGLVSEGMIVKFINEEERNLFILRWAHGTV